jgi:hypothetical protein
VCLFTYAIASQVCFFENRHFFFSSAMIGDLSWWSGSPFVWCLCGWHLCLTVNGVVVVMLFSMLVLSGFSHVVPISVANLLDKESTPYKARKNCPRKKFGGKRNCFCV